MAAKAAGKKASTSPKKAATKKESAAPKKTAAKAPSARMTLAETMAALEAAGSEQTRKTYLRHGASEPLFGVSFATLKVLLKKIGVDHDLALALWGTGNLDARNLAVKVVDPARLSSKELDKWAADAAAQMVVGYVAHVAVETPHALECAKAWLAKQGKVERVVGWALVGAMAMRDEATPDAWFTERLAEIEKHIHTAPNAEREGMNSALICIGCRSPALRKAATAAAKRMGSVEVDHGDTACVTVDAAPRLEKAWAHSTSKGFDSPAAHERSRESMRLRC